MMSIRVIVAVYLLLGPLTQADIAPAAGDALGRLPDVLSASFEEDDDDMTHINWNNTVDYLLNHAKSKAISRGMDEISIPNINRAFTRKVGPVTVRGEFEAYLGRLKNITSLRRTGDVTVEKNGTNFTMTSFFGLDVLQIKYDYYKVRIAYGPRASGAIEGDFGSNSVKVTTSIDLGDGGCVTSVGDVKLVEFGGLKVKVHGLGPLNYLASRITTWLTDVFKSDVVRGIERGVTSLLKRSLEKARCEKYASYFIFVPPK